MSCVAAAGLEHRATENVPFHGFVIPKGMYCGTSLEWVTTYTLIYKSEVRCGPCNPSYWEDGV